MKIVISPAKSLDFESPLPTLEYTTSRFLKESKSINKVIKQKSPKGPKNPSGLPRRVGIQRSKRHGTCTPGKPEVLRVRPGVCPEG